ILAPGVDQLDRRLSLRIRRISLTDTPGQRSSLIFGGDGVECAAFTRHSQIGCSSERTETRPDAAVDEILRDPFERTITRRNKTESWQKAAPRKGALFAG